MSLLIRNWSKKWLMKFTVKEKISTICEWPEFPKINNLKKILKFLKIIFVSRKGNLRIISYTSLIDWLIHMYVQIVFIFNRTNINKSLLYSVMQLF